MWKNKVEAMSFKFVMFRTPKNSQFDYKPRFWDQEKEERDERWKQLEKLRDSSVEGSKARITSGLRRGYTSNATYRKRQVLRSNFILVGIIVMLLFFCYVFLTQFLPQIESFVGGVQNAQ